MKSVQRGGPHCQAGASGGGGARRLGEDPRCVFEHLDAAVERAAANHVERDVGIPFVDPLLTVIPVMTGKTNTRNRSTSPAERSERHSVRLPIVRIDSNPFCFISRTASTASRATSLVFGHARGSCNVVEKTTLDIAARESVPGSPSAAYPDITR